MYFLEAHESYIKDFILQRGFDKFRYDQIIDWIFQKNAIDFDCMSNLSKELRDVLKKELKLYSLVIKKIQTSLDGQTKKYLFELKDGFLIESVLILSEKRITICLSTQVGCKVGCFFCASGKKGFFRNLKAYEIIEQILLIANDLKKRPTHIVFMGMGEPLLNVEEVIKAIEIICSSKGFQISQRRVTISTSGIIEGIKKLKESKLKVNLALSLHAPSDEIRKKIMPFSRKYPLKELLKELKSYSQDTKRDISFEYILIESINDSIEDATKVAQLLKGFQCFINLIPYNPIQGVDYKTPHKDRIEGFKKLLIEKGFKVIQRYTKGDKIAAACGQLALQS